MFKKLVCINIMLIISGVFGSEIESETKATSGVQWRAAESLRRKGAISEAVAAYLTLETCEDIKYRFFAANGLLKCQAFEDAARIYLGILNISNEVDWMILAASGLSDCGAAYKGSAILRLMHISQSASATETQKAYAKWYLEDLNKELAKPQ